jgi:hypothetical protein
MAASGPVVHSLGDITYSLDTLLTSFLEKEAD